MTNALEISTGYIQRGCIYSSEFFRGAMGHFPGGCSRNGVAFYVGNNAKM